MANESDMLMADENLELNLEEDQIQNTPINEDSSTGLNNKITLNVAPVEIETQIDNDPLTPLEDQTSLPCFYKLATQSTISELEWTVTHSRYDFPWQEVQFGPYSSKECYKMYRSLVKDANSFLDLVLGRKNKFLRIMQNQLNGRLTYDTQLNMNMIKSSSKNQSNYPRKQTLSKQGTLLKKRKSKNSNPYGGYHDGIELQMPPTG